ncbi:methyltransferase-like protein 25B isoform X2 [Chiloscyllium punctatum]|uniref:methyltransferase-like protein 25B isoform X2 n=1 Tax=Chiloscyllium punctatum TaxID=137246 RepID=UPI003B63792E
MDADGERRRIAAIVRLLSVCPHIPDSYMTEFFSENLWEKVPRSWRETLSKLTAPQLAALLLERGPCAGRESVWPLSLLAFRASAHGLALSRHPRSSDPSALATALSHQPEDPWANGCQSSMLSHPFRKHVKPKKQHEIRRLGALVKKLCDATGCQHVVDVGSGQGHLSRYLAFGHGLRVTGVEAGEELVTAATRFDSELLLSLRKEAARKLECRRDIPDEEVTGQLLPHHLVGRVGSGASEEDLLQLLEAQGSPGLEGSPFVLTGLHACGDLGPTALRQFAQCPRVLGVTAVSCCYMKVTTGSTAESGYPMSTWVRGLPGHGLPYKLRELACHAIEDYAGRLKQRSTGLRVHCYRATLETIIRKIDPSLKRPGVQTPRNAHLLSFEDYARAGLRRLGLDADAQWDSDLVSSMLAQEARVLAYFCLCLVLAPAIETLILLDRVIYLKEQGFQCKVIPLFDPTFSPRNFVLVAAKGDRRVSDLLTCLEEGAGCT